MIHGIGTDIVAIARMEKMCERDDDKFAKRILADSEFEQYQHSHQKASFLAKRYAAKEAAAKAMGTGFRDGLSLRHIYVTNNALGKPQLHFSERAAELCQTMAIGEAYLSLSDEDEFAIAFVTLLSKR